MFISSYTIHTHFPTPLSNPHLSQPSTYFTLFHTLCVTHILYTHISYPHAHTHFFCHPSLSTPPCTQPSLSSHSSYSTPTSPFLLYLMSIQPPRGLSEIHQGPKKLFAFKPRLYFAFSLKVMWTPFLSWIVQRGGYQVPEFFFFFYMFSIPISFMYKSGRLPPAGMLQGQFPDPKKNLHPVSGPFSIPSAGWGETESEDDHSYTHIDTEKSRSRPGSDAPTDNPDDGLDAESGDGEKSKWWSWVMMLIYLIWEAPTTWTLRKWDSKGEIPTGQANALEAGHMAHFRQRKDGL